jgi:hypothetical protein
MTVEPMSVNEIDADILSYVVARFVDLRVSTSRRDLIVKFKNADALLSLNNRMVLRRKNAGNVEEYLPTAAAFQLSGKARFRETAKLGVTVVLHALQNMYVGEPKDAGYTFDDLKSHVSEVYRNRRLDDETLAGC